MKPKAFIRASLVPAGVSEALKITLPMLLLVVGAFYIAFQFVKPAPPDHIRILAGSEDGIYYRTALRYQEALKENGIMAEVVETSGSVDNLNRLQAVDGDDASSTIAFVQAGVTPTLQEASKAGQIEALASLYYEPVWLFVRKDIHLPDLRDLSALRVAVGSDGSGSRAMAETLYALNGLQVPQTPESRIGGVDAVAALILGQVDAALLVGGVETQVINDLLADPGLSLHSFHRAKAYARILPYIEELNLPEGTLDLAANMPPADTSLIATTAMLVAREDLHPALVDLLLMAATDIHADGGLFEPEEAFPSAYKISLPHNENARRFLRRGPSFLQRVLPFWAATLLDRWLVMLLPLLTLLLPLARLLPPLYSWRIRARIARPYKALRHIEAMTARESEALEKLAEVEKDVNELSVPPTYADKLYDLKFHIRQIRKRLERRGL